LWIENKPEQEATIAIVPEDDDDDHVMVDNFDPPQQQHQQQQQVELKNINNRNAAATTSSSTPLVYQQAAGGGPALLVPGVLLQNQGLPYAALGQQTSTVAVAAAAPFGNAGFDSSNMTTRDQPQQQQQHERQQGVNNGVDLHSMLLGGPSGIMGMMQPPAPLNPPPGFGIPAPHPVPPDAPIAGFDLQNIGLMPSGLLGAIPPSQPMQPMSDSLHLLDGVSLATSNPFASTTASNNSMYDVAINGSIIPPLRQENISFLGGGGGDDDEMAGVDLLGSGLLHSLWGSGEDNTGSYSTRNPFYTAS
jgi:hypothetical protein